MVLQGIQSGHSSHGKTVMVNDEQAHSCSQCEMALERQMLGSDSDRGPQKVTVRRMTPEQIALGEKEAQERERFGSDYLPYRR